MTPATLKALIKGDEAAGQRDFTSDDTLPVECHNCTWEQLGAMGIERHEEVDDLFVAVTLPPGWKKVAKAHPMWSELVDEKGRRRASIFYKAAFYDRRSHIRIERRFHYRVQPQGGYTDDFEADNQKIYECVVFDCNNPIWVSDTKLSSQPEDYNLHLAWYDATYELEATGREYLERNYPDWENPMAYWDTGPIDD